MSELEKTVAKELLESAVNASEVARDYVRGYLQGQIDAVKAGKHDARTNPTEKRNP